MIDVKVTITRFNPAHDTASRPQVYEMSVRENQTILDLLMDLATYHDPSVSFRRACRSGICGTCAVAINGEPRLACETLVSSVASGGEIAIGPLPHFRVLKDLVVDMDSFLDSLERMVPWMVLRPDYDGRMEQAQVRRIEKANECILCGICLSYPNVGENDPRAYLNPAALVKGFRLAFDPRDVLGEERAKLARDLGLLERPIDASGKLGCPKEIPIGQQIMPDMKRAVGEG
jgi:succinate dehydrogenase / fumarate reductase, iron-sulfur subunit